MPYHEIILASKSPRRKELLADANIPFHIITVSGNEIFDTRITKEKAIEQIAEVKARNVLTQHPDAIVLGADTMVCLDGVVLGKPKDKADAKRMLNLLSGKTHDVVTAVAILTKDITRIFHETTKVTFYDLDEHIIEEYLVSEESYDKAGAYGIQGKGKVLVKSIEGDYFNVVGLPIARVYRELKKLMQI